MINQKSILYVMGANSDAITITILILVAVFCVFFLVIEKLKAHKKTKTKELKTSPDAEAHGVIFGKLGRKVVYSPIDAEGSIGVFSASGTGKTSAVGISTLQSIENEGTSFVIDISGDILKNCPDMPAKLVYQPEDAATTPYNIFGSVDDLEDEDEKNEALEQLAFLMMPETTQMNDNAKFFLTNGRKILTASLIAFYKAGMDFIEICEKIVGSSYQELFRSIDETKTQEAIIYINSFVGASEQNTAGCKQACDDAIKLFATNGKIKKSIRRPKKNEEAVESKLIENHNIFIVIDDEKLALYSPLLKIITSQQMQYISKRQVTTESKTILLFLDEFASLMIDAQMTLEALRKYRKRKCRVMIMTQNLADLDLLYGHETTRAIMANLRFKVLLGGLGEPESQKYFAELIGYKKTTKKSTSKSSKATTTTESEAKEYIIEPADLDRQGKDVAILIHPEGEGWMKLKKNYYFK